MFSDSLKSVLLFKTMDKAIHMVSMKHTGYTVGVVILK